MQRPVQDLQDSSLEEVRKALELDLVPGLLRPRERLLEDDLMLRFGAKRHVVRPALIELERAGLVERRPNRGSVVRDYSREEVGQLYELRADLHRLAVMRMTLPAARAVTDELSEVADRHETAIKAGDLAHVIEFDTIFHDRLFDLCGNVQLANTIRQLGNAANAIRSYRTGDAELLTQAAREHRLMIEALAQSDRDHLAALTVDHIQPSKRIYLADARRREPASDGSDA